MLCSLRKSTSEALLPTPVQTGKVNPASIGTGQSKQSSVVQTTVASNPDTILEPGIPLQNTTVDSAPHLNRALVLVQKADIKAWKQDYGFFQKRLELDAKGKTELGIFTFDNVYHNGTKVNPGFFLNFVVVRLLCKKLVCYNFSTKFQCIRTN